MERRNEEKQVTRTTAVNQKKIVDVRYRRLLRDVMSIPLEEAKADVSAIEQEDETASLLAYIFASDR
ncbi:hypothetical protein BVY04_01855 [bacterium M21]|nr:hypothetical protein BVY04_01855 [bacterium M21]